MINKTGHSEGNATNCHVGINDFDPVIPDWHPPVQKFAACI